jgi:hypothetical protein
MAEILSKGLFIEKKDLSLQPDHKRNKINNIIENEENISTFQQEKKEQTRLSFENGYGQWPQGIGFSPCKGER